MRIVSLLPLTKEAKKIGFHIKRCRTAAYTALAKAMDISAENCHIAVFTEDQCRKVIKLCTNRELHISL